MEPGTIIELNGTSSSGKATLDRALQETLDAPFLDVSIDRFTSAAASSPPPAAEYVR